MATIRRRRRCDGSLAYLAEVRIKRDGRLVHRESKTFDKRRFATEWATRLESQLSKPDAVPKRKQLALSGPLHKILLKYRKEVSEIRPMGRSKSAHKKYPGPHLVIHRSSILLILMSKYVRGNPQASGSTCIRTCGPLER